VLAGSWNADNANAFLYYALHVLPLLAVAMLVLNAGSLTPLPRVEVAKLSGLIVLCTVLNVFILRHPVGARIGGIAGPAAVLATWLWHHVWSMRSSLWGRTAKTVGVMALLLTAWSVSASADWQGRLASATVSPSEWVTSASALAASPPDPAIVGGRELTNMVRYLRECTGPRDRILVTWFAPEVYFFAQRGFAAGLATLASGHWSEERFQQRSVESLESRPAALVIHRSRDRDFTEQYPLLSNYLRQHYHDVGTTDFSGESSSGGSFVVLVHNDRANSMIHGPTSLPCFP
jgi:hypothetical protein